MQPVLDATLQEERGEVLDCVREAMAGIECDPELAAAAGLLLRHVANTTVHATLARLKN